MTGPVEQPTAAPARPQLDEVLAAAAELVDGTPPSVEVALELAAAVELAAELERGVDVGPPDPAPAQWVERVRELIAEHPELPPLYVDPASAGSTHGRWALHPWLPLGDLHALLAWARHLDGSIAVWRAGPDGLLHVCGLIAGYPTAVIGHSSLLPASPALLDLAELQRCRDREHRTWGFFTAPPTAAAAAP